MTSPQVDRHERTLERIADLEAQMVRARAALDQADADRRTATESLVAAQAKVTAADAAVKAAETRHQKASADLGSVQGQIAAAQRMLQLGQA